MSQNFDAGANLTTTGGPEYFRIPTKKLLKRALLESPERLLFDNTSIRGQGNWTPAQLAENPEIVLYVVGPDPYSERKWYARVRWSPTVKRVVCT